MKRVRKNGIEIWLVIVLFFAQVIGAKAQGDNKLRIENYQAEEGILSVYVQKSGEETPDAGNVAVEIGNIQLPVLDVEQVRIAEEPVTYYCLVDVSGSMGQARIDSVKEMLQQLIGRMKDGDNMVIATIADNLDVSDYLSGKEQLSALVEQIEGTMQDTNLYYAIQNAVQSLTSRQEVNRKRCMIIFSDGADEQANGITKDEALKTVEEADIPIYTVAMLKQNASDAQLEAAKILGNFARISAGGLHLVPALEGYGYDEIMERIHSAMDSTSYRIVCELKDVPLTGSTVEIRTIWRLEDGSEGIDREEVFANTLADFIVYTPQEIEIPEQEETEPESADEEYAEDVSGGETEGAEESEENGGNAEEGNSMVLIVSLLIAAVVVFAVVIVLLIVNKKKKRRAQEAEMHKRQESAESVQREAAPERVQNIQPSAPMPAAPPPVIPEPEKMPEKYVRLIRLGVKTNVVIDMNVAGPCMIGHSSAKSNYVITDDKSVSSRHCSLIYKNKHIYIKDEGSSNGTYVNGVAICGEYMLNEDDVVSIGNYKYRLVWK
ncbi:MAG: VWA domain-containing protein [bacterium]|nr:VWA domain-containing protein [bacterium]